MSAWSEYIESDLIHENEKIGMDESLMLRIVIDGRAEVVRLVSHSEGVISVERETGIDDINVDKISCFRVVTEKDGFTVKKFTQPTERERYASTGGYKTPMVPAEGATKK